LSEKAPASGLATVRAPSSTTLPDERDLPYSIILILPQSGQIQVGPLVMPHLFSSKQAGQIWKPHWQFQQNSCSLPQQWHLNFFFLPRLVFFFFSASFFMAGGCFLLDAAIGQIISRYHHGFNSAASQFA
jgi:hypothetical protein